MARNSAAMNDPVARKSRNNGVWQPGAGRPVAAMAARQCIAMEMRCQLWLASAADDRAK